MLLLARLIIFWWFPCCSYELETLLDTQDDVLDIQALKIRIDATAMDHGLDIRRVPVGTAEHSDLDEIGEVMHGSLKVGLPCG